MMQGNRLNWFLAVEISQVEEEELAVRKKKTLFLLLFFTLTIGALPAFAINFNEVPLGFTDPTIGGVSFWAGNPAAVPANDTYVEDSLMPGNGYLMSGYDDGTGNSPGLYDTFIGASNGAGLWGSVSFDVALNDFLPPGSNIWVRGLLAGVDQGSASVSIGDFDYHNLSIGFVNGADKIYIWDDLSGGFGDPFNIDNFIGTPYVAPPPPPPPPAVPEPSTLALTLTGLAGAWFLNRKRNI